MRSGLLIVHPSRRRYRPPGSTVKFESWISDHDNGDDSGLRVVIHLFFPVERLCSRVPLSGIALQRFVRHVRLSEIFFNKLNRLALF